jgi:hypothetical protein
MSDSGTEVEGFSFSIAVNNRRWRGSRPSRRRIRPIMRGWGGAGAHPEQCRRATPTVRKPTLPPELPFPLDHLSSYRLPGTNRIAVPVTRV